MALWKCRSKETSETHCDIRIEIIKQQGIFGIIASSSLNYLNFSTSCPFWQFPKVITQRITTEYKIEHFNHVVEMVAYIYPFLTSNLTLFICKVYLHLFITQRQNIIITIT